MIDSSIAMGVKPVQIENPMNALAQMLQIQQGQQANQLNQMKMDEYTQGVSDKNAMRQLLGGFGQDHEANAMKLLQGGHLAEAQAYTKNRQDLDKVKADTAKTYGEVEFKKIETAHKRMESMGQRFGYVRDNPTAENAISVTQSLIQDGLMSQEQGDAAIAKIQADPSPQTIQALATQAYQGALSAKDQLPTLGGFNAGDRYVQTSRNPMTGVSTETGSTAIGQSVDNLKNNERLVAEGAKNRYVQTRGQDLVNERSRDTIQSAKAPAGYRWSADGKSLEVISGGPADKGSAASEGERKAATLLQRLEFSSGQLDAARKDNPGASKPGLISNGLESIGMDATANSMKSSERQRIEGAQLDMLDAALTLGTGAAYTNEQLKGYAKSYFPQIGDDAKAIKDKDARLKNVISAAKIAAGRAAKSVNSGGAEGDFGDAPAKKPTPATNSQGWVLHTDANGNKAYVSPDGKQFQEAK